MEPDEQARVGESEAMFRDVNETVVHAERGTDPVVVLCECADEFCGENLILSRAAYEEVRSVSEYFIVAPEHVLPEIEQVVEKHSLYWVIRKLGLAGEVADATDPRTTE